MLWTLIESLETITRNTCCIRLPDGNGHGETFEVTTQANDKRQRALGLLREIADLPQAKAGL